MQQPLAESVLEYSVLSHLGEAIWVGDYSKENVFAMLTDLTGYFDDAGGTDHGFTVVAGWVSTVAKWEQFDTDWRLLLARYDLPTSA